MRQENKNSQIKIQPLRIRNLNCYDNNIIADISRLFKRDYRLSLLGEFDFTYRNIDKTEELLDYNDIYTGDILYVPQMLSRFASISLEHIEVNNKESIFMFIEQVLSYIEYDFPVGVGIDSYYLPWNPQFKNLHRRHYFLIIGFDLNEGVFYCLDSYLSKQINKIPISLIYHEYDRLILVKGIENEKSYSINIIIKELESCLFNSGKLLNCDSIRGFAKDILSNRFLKDQRVSGDLLEKSNLLFRLTDVADSRYNFSQALYSLATTKRCDAFSKTTEKVLDVYEYWKLLKNIIVKGYISGRVIMSFHKASELLNKIAVKEENILNELQMIGKESEE